MLLNTWNGLNHWQTTEVYATVSDAIKGITGQGINEGWGQLFSKTANEHVQDAERRWLIAQGGSGGANQDMWKELFGPGDIAKIQLDYLNSIA